MANMVTRTITKFEVTAKKVVVNRKARTFEEREVGRTEVEGIGKPTRKAIVASFEEQGIHIEKGTEFEFKAIGYRTVGQPVEFFLEHAVDVKSGEDTED